MRNFFTMLFLLGFASAVYAQQNLIPIQQGTKWGYADAQGNIVVEPVYSQVSRFADGYGAVYDENGKVGLVESTGKVVIEPKYDYIDLCSEGIVAVYMFDGDIKDWGIGGEWNYINLANPDSLLFGASFALAGPFINGRAWADYGFVDRTTKRAFRYMPIMDKKGKKEIGRDIIFGVSESFKMNDLYAKDENGDPVVGDGKWILIGKDMRSYTDTDSTYQMVGEFQDGLAWVKRNGLYGFVNMMGEEVIPVKYRAVQGCPEGAVISLQLNPESGAIRWVMDEKGYMAWLNEKGEPVIDFVKTNGRISITSTVEETLWDF